MIEMHMNVVSDPLSNIHKTIALKVVKIIVDTQTELSSCGGCVNEGNGTDCESLPGVARGGVTCHQGQCRVMKCLEGWTTSDG